MGSISSILWISKACIITLKFCLFSAIFGFFWTCLKLLFETFLRARWWLEMAPRMLWPIHLLKMSCIIYFVSFYFHIEVAERVNVFSFLGMYEISNGLPCMSNEYHGAYFSNHKNVIKPVYILQIWLLWAIFELSRIWRVFLLSNTFRKCPMILGMSPGLLWPHHHKILHTTINLYNSIPY